MEEIERTALWVAGMRALELEHENPLFCDPFAKQLVDESFLENLRRSNTNSYMPPAIEVRTRWLDDEIVFALETGVRQVVILGAGMDSRAYRLELPENTRLYELDHLNVLQYKQSRLADAVPRCQRIALAVDLQEEWPFLLQENGFIPETPTVWVIEGLLCYFNTEQVQHLFSRLNTLSSINSVILCDIIGLSMLQSPRSKELHDLAQQFGTDEPEVLLEPLGWHVSVCTIAAMGHQLGRWPFPIQPRGTPGIPQSFLVQAVK